MNYISHGLRKKGTSTMSDSEENRGKLYWGVLPECIYNKFFCVKISYRDAKLAEYWSYIELQVLASAFLLRESPAEALRYLDMVCELKDSPAVIAENRNILSKDFSGKVKIQLPDHDVSLAACDLIEEITRDFCKAMNVKITQLQNIIGEKKHNPKARGGRYCLRYSKALSIESLQWLRDYLKVDNGCKSDYEFLRKHSGLHYHTKEFDALRKSWSNVKKCFVKECAKTRRLAEIRNLRYMYEAYCINRLKGCQDIEFDPETGCHATLVAKVRSSLDKQISLD